MSDVPITVSGVFADAAGVPASGRVTFRPHVQARNTSTTRIVTRRTVTADLDENGAFTVTVVASDDSDWLTAGSIRYEVDQRLVGCDRETYTVALDGVGGTVDLADLQATRVDL